MNLLRIFKSRVLAAHFVFWIAVWFFFAWFFSYNSGNSKYVTWFTSFLLPLTMAVTYFVVYNLIPKYLHTGKYFLLALYTFYTIVFSSYLLVLIIIGSYVFLSNFDLQAMPPMAKNVVSVIIMVYMIVGLASFISLLNYNYQTQAKNKELQNKILSTRLQMKEQELQYLKKQIHPHFLFNTLNTIYGFAMKKSIHTPDIILKLSNLLDYILYQIDKPLVSLKNEIHHITEYINLEQIRFHDTLKVECDFGTVGEDVQIAPMLLMPFVENAFKHGSIINDVLLIDIKLNIAESNLKFVVRNTFSVNGTETKSGGVGLANIKKRLDLHYAGNYNLLSGITGSFYEVQLEIFDLNMFKNG